MAWAKDRGGTKWAGTLRQIAPRRDSDRTDEIPEMVWCVISSLGIGPRATSGTKNEAKIMSCGKISPTANGSDNSATDDAKSDRRCGTGVELVDDLNISSNWPFWGTSAPRPIDRDWVIG